MSDNLILRGKTYYLKRRVPSRYAEVEPRPVIWESLKTDSRTIAGQKLERVWSGYLDGWEAKLAGRDGDAEARFRAARNLAATRGYAFLTAEAVSTLPLAELLARVESTQIKIGLPEPETALAVLGGVEEPGLLLSDLVAHIEEISAHENRFKSTQQMRLWRNDRKRSVANLITALGGDRSVAQIGAAEARVHRKWWKARLVTEKLKIDSANKDLTYMSGMLRRYYDHLEHPDPPRPYAGVTIRDRHAKPARKKEVPVDWITERWLKPGALDGLNNEARDILLISIETGCRQSEIFELPAHAFQLNVAIPHLLIANEDGEKDEIDRREIKNIHSERQVPLVGLALAAARRHPDGFPRYRHTRNYSDTVNKFLRENDLLPKGVTIGGVRHMWESRLKAAGVAMDDRGEIMGHSVKEIRGREVYGDDIELQMRRNVVSKIALPVPEHLM
ncbi:hypothetical protein SAMN04488004_110152 [Loktanella salsilacus]|uniref:DUF6538 domain-containing protein n=1 Tax=Loktanella salsilacus TaxID=195913 RepID=A0A1I4FY83_9RHOB|nr:DUF6538 domain-containing protein [Loktanella salsilacus]SFL21776.1 hypothetical protein SAMN04488004_110152 [Loktanella salsilacus]